MPSRIWWMMLLRGVLGIVLGAMLILWPQEGAQGMVMLIGAFAALIGTLIIAHALLARFIAWPHSLGAGVVALLVGLFALMAPAPAASVMVWIVAAWATIAGVLELITASMLARMGLDESIIRGLGIISVIFGGILALRPGAGIVAAALLIGLYFLATGVLLLWYALRVRDTVA